MIAFFHDLWWMVCEPNGGIFVFIAALLVAGLYVLLNECVIQPALDRRAERQEAEFEAQRQKFAGVMTGPRR